jgi:hypothetical protein
LFEYYEEPKSITSIIHASRANIMTVYHPYVIRKSSLSNLSEINNPTSIIFDDLEFFSMLEYRNLIYSSIKKVLIFSRIHSDIRRTKQTDFAEKINVSEEIERVRNLCDTYRPQDFTASTLDLEAGDSDEIDLENILDQTKKEIEKKLLYKLWGLSIVLFSMYLLSTESFSNFKDFFKFLIISVFAASTFVSSFISIFWRIYFNERIHPYIALLPSVLILGFVLRILPFYDDNLIQFLGNFNIPYVISKLLIILPIIYIFFKLMMWLAKEKKWKRLLVQIIP